MATGSLQIVILATATLLIGVGHAAAYFPRPEGRYQPFDQGQAQRRYPQFVEEQDYAPRDGLLQETSDSSNYWPSQLDDMQTQSEPIENKPFEPELQPLKKQNNLTKTTAQSTTKQCRNDYTKTLRELVEIKKTCKKVGFDDCCQVKNIFTFSMTGIYNFEEFCGAPSNTFADEECAVTMEGRCDMETAGGGWMVIQRRLPKGVENFTRSYSEYENGFGDLNNEFWYGLKNIHCLTNTKDMELRIDMVKKADGAKLTYTYETFKVGDATDKYRLTIGGGKGTGEDAMAYHNGEQFTTYDQDNDKNAKNCGYHESGGWWYKSCYGANLNGPHTRLDLPGIDTGHAILEWKDGTWQSLSSAEMKIRPKKCLG